MVKYVLAAAATLPHQLAMEHGLRHGGKIWMRKLQHRYKVKANAAGSARRTYRFMRVALQGCGCCRA